MSAALRVGNLRKFMLGRSAVFCRHTRVAFHHASGDRIVFARQVGTARVPLSMLTLRRSSAT